MNVIVLCHTGNRVKLPRNLSQLFVNPSTNFFQIISFGKFKKMVQAIAILKTKLFLFLVTTISFRN